MNTDLYYSSKNREMINKEYKVSGVFNLKAVILYAKSFDDAKKIIDRLELTKWTIAVV